MSEEIKKEEKEAAIEQQAPADEFELVTDKKAIAEVRIGLIFRELGISIDEQMKYHEMEYNRLAKIKQAY